jgi:hypothetical protein
MKMEHISTKLMIADILTKSPGAIVGGGSAWTTFAKMLIG